MSSIPSQSRSFLPVFFRARLFTHLSPNACRQLASKVVLRGFQPGEIIQAEATIPGAVRCVVQGQVRVVGPVNRGLPTIALLDASDDSGELFGWESYVRKTTCGSIRAAGLGEVLTLGVSIDDFEAIVLPELQSTLAQHISPIEVYDLLLRFCDAVPPRLNLPDLAKVSRYLIAHNRVTCAHWFGKPSAQFQLSSDYLWLVSGSGSFEVAIGTIVNGIDQLPVGAGGVLPLRLIGIDRDALTSIVSTGALPDPDAIPTRSNTGDAVLVHLEHLSQPPAPIAPARVPKTYPAHLARGSTFAEAVVTAFWNLSEYLDIPYKPAFLRQWSESLEAQPRDQLQWYVGVAKAFEINAHVVKFPATPSGVVRLQTPSILLVESVPCVVYAIREKGITIASPTRGLMELSSQEIVDRLTVCDRTAEAPISEAVLFTRQANSRTDQFGWWWLIGFFKPYRRDLAFVLLASIFVQLFGLANPLLTQQIVDRVIINGSPGVLPLLGSLLIGSTVFESILTVARTHLLNDTTNRVDLQVGYQIVKHLFTLPLPFFQKRPVGELATRINELETVRQFLTGTFISVVLDVLFSLIYVGVMLLYSGTLTLCVVGTVPLIMGLTLAAAPMYQHQIRKRADQHAQTQSHLIEMLNAMFTVKAQRLESSILFTWQQQYRAYLKTGLRTTMIGAWFQALNSLVNNASSLLVLWVGSTLVLENKLTLGQLIAFRIIAGYVTQPLVRLSSLWRNAQEANASMELLADVKNEAPEFSELDAGRLALPPIQGRVQYLNVDFGFQSGQLQLINTTLDIAPGTFVGVVGQSGSGKSTMLKLLPRYYNPESGQVLIDGIDIAKVNLVSLREQIGVVQQEPNLFRGNIQTNIASGAEEIDEAAVIEAAKIAEAHDFIMELPDGYATEVGERGATLSGGQRQRIAIAAMVYRNPRLVILDEATSALDAEIERRVVENLMRRFEHTTCFFITHRLSNLRRADLILYLQFGAIVERGTHLELITQRQQYYCLYQQQTHTS